MKEGENKKSKEIDVPLLFLKCIFILKSYTLCLGSSDTEIFFLPFPLRFERIFLPLTEAILSRNPCLFFRFLFEG